MRHPALNFKPVLNGTQYDDFAYAKVLITGGLTYKDSSGKEQCAWKGGYYGEGGTAAKPAPWTVRWQEMDWSKFKDFAQSVTASIFTLNIERYGVDGAARMVDIVERFRFYRPDVPVGIWSVVPSSNWSMLYDFGQFVDYQEGRPPITMADGWWKTVGAQRTEAFQAWQRGNDFIARKLVPHVDFTMPSIYPVHDISAAPAWSLAKEPELMIWESRRLAPELPCFPCYYPWLQSARRAPSDELTSAILGVCKRDADGTVIWGDVNTTRANLQNTLNAASRLSVSPTSPSTTS